MKGGGDLFSSSAEKELDSEEDGGDEEGKEYLKALAKKVHLHLFL